MCCKLREISSFHDDMLRILVLWDLRLCSAYFTVPRRSEGMRHLHLQGLICPREIVLVPHYKLPRKKKKKKKNRAIAMLDLS